MEGCVVVNLLILLCTSVVQTGALSCFSCLSIDDPLTCNISNVCSSGQVCFLKEHEGVYRMGCENNQQCGGVAGPGIIGRGIQERQSSSCLECCSTDGCNSHLCKHQKPSSCIDDETVDCAKMNSFFHICKDIHQASLVCPKFCNLCTLVDGNWASWSVWTNCDVTCETGSQTRTRACTNPSPANGGLDCVGSTTEVKTCQLDTCPVHGGWSLWSIWGSCSVTCGVGMQRRDRSCSNPYPTLYGDHCFGESRDDRICMPKACSDGGWSSWDSWGACSDSCGGGVKSRSRTCTNPKPSLLGRYCDGSNDQTEPCNKIPCHDGGWSSWDRWSACSDNCGGGVKSRSRTCTHPMPSLLGRYCAGSSDQTESCNKIPCHDGGWSSWGIWGACSDSCGGGVKSRLRTCTNPKPSLLGRYCDGSNDQVIPCNKNPCPGSKVAFTAHGTNVINSYSLRFPIIDENYGNGYDSSTGKFTSPVAGIYNFAVTLSKGWGSAIDGVYCNLYINLNAKLKTGENPYGDNRDGYSMTMSGTFHLNRNDTVNVGGCSGTRGLLNDFRCAFTGFLVVPDN